MEEKVGERGTLQRALGRWDLTAFGVNIVIGGGVFLTPSLVAAELGNWSPIAVLVAGVAVLCIALTYAEVGSRFDSTGGPYLYTLAAFGPFVAFEVGWMAWFTRVASIAALVHGVALAVGYYAPAVSEGWPRARAHDRRRSLPSRSSTRAASARAHSSSTASRSRNSCRSRSSLSGALLRRLVAPRAAPRSQRNEWGRARCSVYAWVDTK